jgi:hypothetical protein
VPCMTSTGVLPTRRAEIGPILSGIAAGFGGSAIELLDVARARVLNVVAVGLPRVADRVPGYVRSILTVAVIGKIAGASLYRVRTT